jgi:hypothetical protein
VPAADMDEQVTEHDADRGAAQPEERAAQRLRGVGGHQVAEEDRQLRPVQPLSRHRLPGHDGDRACDGDLDGGAEVGGGHRGTVEQPGGARGRGLGADRRRAGQPAVDELDGRGEVGARGRDLHLGDGAVEPVPGAGEVVAHQSGRADHEPNKATIMAPARPFAASCISRPTGAVSVSRAEAGDRRRPPAPA